MGTAIWQNHNLFRVWAWCMMKATWMERETTIGLTKILLQPGQFIFGRNTAASELGMSPSTVYDCVQRLVDYNKLDIKSDNKKSVITVVNWALYQSESSHSDNKIGNQIASTANPATNPRTTSSNPNIKKWAETEQNQTFLGLTAAETDSKPVNKTAKSDSKPDTNNNNNNVNNINYNRTTGDSVDNLLTRMSTIIGPVAAQHWLQERGPDYCQAQVAELDRQGTSIRNQRQWLLAALARNYAQWKAPAPQPDPNCPKCGGTGEATDWVQEANGGWTGHSRPCSCVPRTRHTPSMPTASDPNPALLAAAALAIRLQARGRDAATRG